MENALAGAGFVDRMLTAYARGPEHPTKVRVLHWLIRRLSAGQTRFRYASGATIAIDPADYIGWAILRTGHYEPESLDLALRLMSTTPGLFVDVGANFGWYSCAVAAVAGSTVIAIEPDSANCAALRANIRRNGFRNAVVVNTAAGIGFDIGKMVRRADANSGTMAIDPIGAPDACDGNWVAMVSLDHLLRRIIDPPERPVLIKIDVEGFEPQVLAGLDLAGPFRPRNIIMEYEAALSEKAWGGRAGVQAFFSSRGYDVLDVTGRPLAADRNLIEANLWAREQ
jgi:FkbM family methyltransferase